MCIIIDVNVAASFCKTPLSQDADEVVQWVRHRRGKIVSGGKLTAELKKNNKFWKWLTGMRKAGFVVLITNKDSLNAAEKTIKSNPLVKSDDPHVLAVAAVSRARVLYTNDVDLIQDFCHGKILAKPRGKVYSSHKIKNVLAHTKYCIGRPSKKK